MSEVLVLGTGSADGWPNPFCGCASCRVEAAAGRTRGQTSALVDRTLLLDCGPESPRAALRAGVDLAGVRYVLLTHAHPDHCAPAFLLYRSWACDRPLEVLGPVDALDQCRPWVAPDAPVRFTPVRAGDRHQLEGHDVRVLPASHGPDAVLYDVATPSARLLYATDTGPLPEAAVAATVGAAYDLVLLEETFGDHTDHGTGHLDLATFPQQLRRLRGAGAVTAATDIVAVHLSHHNPSTPELDRRLAAWAARTVADGTPLHPGRSPGRHAAPSAAPSSLRPELRPDGDRPRRTLVLGGARSGKSQEAQRLLAAEPEVVYVATGYPPGDDPEWAARVRRHQVDRPGHWETCESLDLAALLDQDGPPLLVDCLTLWLTRVMDRHRAWDDDVWAADGEGALDREITALVRAWRGTRRRVVAVSNEVGQGVVPGTGSGRRFRDLMGRVNAAVAAECEAVHWCQAGRVRQL